MTKNPSGIRVSIFKDSVIGTCANGGISDRFNEALLVLPHGGPFEPTEDCPAIRIEPGNIGGLKAVPVDQPEDQAGPMMGGSYIATSDSRFSEHCRKRLLDSLTHLPPQVAREVVANFNGAVPLHDRWDTWANHEILSR